VPRLRPRPETPAAPQIESAIVMQEFRPAQVGVLYRRYQQLPLDHPVVRAHPQFFMGLVRLEEEVKEDAR